MKYDGKLCCCGQTEQLNHYIFCDKSIFSTGHCHCSRHSHVGFFPLCFCPSCAVSHLWLQQREIVPKKKLAKMILVIQFFLLEEKTRKMEKKWQKTREKKLKSIHCTPCERDIQKLTGEFLNWNNVAFLSSHQKLCTFEQIAYI